MDFARFFGAAYTIYIGRSRRPPAGGRRDLVPEQLANGRGALLPAPQNRRAAWPGVGWRLLDELQRAAAPGPFGPAALFVGRELLPGTSAAAQPLCRPERAYPPQEQKLDQGRATRCYCSTGGTDLCDGGPNAPWTNWRLGRPGAEVNAPSTLSWLCRRACSGLRTCRPRRGPHCLLLGLPTSRTGGEDGRL